MCIARKLYIGSLAISRAINKEFSLIVEPYLNWGLYVSVGFSHWGLPWPISGFIRTVIKIFRAVK